MNSLLLILGTLPAADPCPSCPVPQPGHTFPFADLSARASPAETPNWDATIRRAGWCPGPAVQAFQKLPRVCPVEVCPCATGEGGAYSPKVWVKEFHHAAHVPLPRFTIDGKEIAAEGLLIYEGMRLTVDPVSGNYDLSFTATVPNMPVTLRMQLILTEPVPEKEMGTKTPREYRLTLPAIRMEPPKDARPGDLTPNTFHIAHRGYSSLFIDPKHWQTLPRESVPLTECTPRSTIACDWLLSRIGTARFGTSVAIESPDR